MTEERAAASLVGTTVVSSRRTLSETEFSVLLSLTWALHPLHLDTEYAQARGFRDRIMDGPLLLALAIGLEVFAGVGRLIDESGIRLIALKEIEHVRFLAPVYPQDAIFTSTEFLDTQPATRPGRWNMHVSTQLYKGVDELVMQASRTFAFELDQK